MKILILAAHPDDELLGCGGGIAKGVAAGAYIDILLVVNTELRERRINIAHATRTVTGALGRCPQDYPYEIMQGEGADEKRLPGSIRYHMMGHGGRLTMLNAPEIAGEIE